VGIDGVDLHVSTHVWDTTGRRDRSRDERRGQARRRSCAIRGRCYCVRNLYATIRATMLAKISSAWRDFRIIGIVEWRAAGRPG
jgi:hypothetical protein